MVEYALKYAAKGWPVIPLHSISNGVCTCGRSDCRSPAKHPRTFRGLTDGSIDPVQITSWWNLWPDSNIGIVTGGESNLVVVDVDDLSVAPTFADTVTARTGSGGKHFYYLHTGEPIKSGVKVLPGTDIRADGGYVVAPPSRHYSGERYEWADSPDDAELASLEPWVIRAIESKPAVVRNAEDSEEIIEGARNTILTSLAGTMRKRGFDEEAIEAALLVKNRKSCRPPLDEEEVSRIAKSVGRYEVKSKEEEELDRHAEMIAKGLEEGMKRKRLEMLDTKPVIDPGIPPNFMPGSGLIKDIATWILGNSERPLPLLAVMSAVAFIGVLAGRKYQSPSGLGPNVIITGLAESGSGKEKARSLIKKLAYVSGVSSLIGADDIASAPGMLTAMQAQPSQLFLMDEFGLALQSMTGSQSGTHKREILALMMKLYSNYGGVYHGTAYADNKNRPRIDIQNPCLCIYGTSTHESFYRSMTSSQGVDGFLARLIVISEGEERPKQERVIYKDVPLSIKGEIEKLNDFRPLLSGLYTVPMHQDVENAFFDLDDEMTSLMKSPAAKSVYARVKENAIKLALIYAVAQDYREPYIDHQAFKWAKDIALWSAHSLMKMIEENISDNEVEKHHQSIYRIVRDSGLDGIRQSELLRRYQKIKKFELEQAIDLLVASGQIFCKTISSETGKGRKGTFWFADIFAKEILNDEERTDTD